MPEMTMLPAASGAAPTTPVTSADAGAESAESAPDFAALLHQQLTGARGTAAGARSAPIDLPADIRGEAESNEDTEATTADQVLNDLLALITPFVPSNAPSPAGASAPLGDDGLTGAAFDLITPTSPDGDTLVAPLSGAAAAALAQTPAGTVTAAAAPTQGAIAVVKEQDVADVRDVRIAAALRSEPSLGSASAEQANAMFDPLPALAGEAPQPGTSARDTLASPQLAQAHQPTGSTNSTRIEAALGTTQWQHEVAQRVSWLAGRNEGSAELILTPPNLGRIEVSLNVSGETTSAYFVSANPTVRDALEQALPRLREVLADAGINLGQASVNAESAPRDDRRNSDGNSRGEAGARSVAAESIGMSTARGLVDTFA